MIMEVLTEINLIVQIAVLAVVLFLTGRMLSRDRFSMLGAFFAFGVSGILLSDLYWIAYMLLEPGTRMPFAVNEIGECAAFLLLASALRTQIEDVDRIRFREALLPGMFMACNVALWIAWSGEWIQDILSGLTLCYYLVVSTSLLRREGARVRIDALAFAAIAALLVILQAATFFVPTGARAVLDACLTAMIAGSTLLILYRGAYALWTGDSAALALAFACFGWTVICMYMSAGMLYTLMSLCFTLDVLMMYLAVRRQVGAA